MRKRKIMALTLVFAIVFSMFSGITVNADSGYIRFDEEILESLPDDTILQIDYNKYVRDSQFYTTDKISRLLVKDSSDGRGYREIFPENEEWESVFIVSPTHQLTFTGDLETARQEIDVEVAYKSIDNKRIIPVTLYYNKILDFGRQSTIVNYGTPLDKGLLSWVEIVNFEAVGNSIMVYPANPEWVNVDVVDANYSVTYTDADYTYKIYDLIVKYDYSDNTYIKPIWVRQPALRYDANGGTSGSVPVDDTVVASGNTLTVQGNVGNLVKNSESFINWNTEPDGSGIPYAGGSPIITKAEITTLYAQYGDLTGYKVNYHDTDSTGGIVPNDVNIYLVGTTATIRDGGTAERSGYKLTAWVDSLGNVYPFNVNTVIVGDLDLYPQWTPIYTITYLMGDADGGEVPIDSTEYLPNSTATIMEGTVYKNGNMLEGWIDELGNEYELASTPTMASSLVLHPKWGNVSYRVIYHTDGADSGNVEDTNTYPSGSFAQVEPQGAMQKAGHNLKYWCTSPIDDGNATTYAVGANIFMISNVDLYPIWEVQASGNYITYNANGGVGTVIDSTNYINPFNPATIQANSFTRENYTFDGYNTKVDGSGLNFSPGQTVGAFIILNAGGVLYAKWTLNTPQTYGITYLKGSKLDVPDYAIPVDATQIAEGMPVTVLPINALEPNFIGWLCLQTGQIVQPWDTVTMQAGGLTLVAQYAAVGPEKYKVFYNIGMNPRVPLFALPNDAQQYAVDDLVVVKGLNTLEDLGLEGMYCIETNTLYQPGDQVAMQAGGLHFIARYSRYEIAYNRGVIPENIELPEDMTQYYKGETATIQQPIVLMLVIDDTKYTFSDWALEGDYTEVDGNPSAITIWGAVKAVAQWIVEQVEEEDDGDVVVEIPEEPEQPQEPEQAQEPEQPEEPQEPEQPEEPNNPPVVTPTPEPKDNDEDEDKDTEAVVVNPDPTPTVKEPAPTPIPTPIPEPTPIPAPVKPIPTPIEEPKEVVVVTEPEVNKEKEEKTAVEQPKQVVVDEPAPVVYGRVYGVVVGPEGPLAGIRVELHSVPRVTYTDVEGRYYFENVELGTHEVILKDPETLETLRVDSVVVHEVDTDAREEYKWGKDTKEVVRAISLDETKTEKQIDFALKVLPTSMQPTETPKVEQPAKKPIPIVPIAVATVLLAATPFIIIVYRRRKAKKLIAKVYDTENVVTKVELKKEGTDYQVDITELDDVWTSLAGVRVVIDKATLKRMLDTKVMVLDSEGYIRAKATIVEAKEDLVLTIE